MKPSCSLSLFIHEWLSAIEYRKQLSSTTDMNAYSWAQKTNKTKKNSIEKNEPLGA